MNERYRITGAPTGHGTHPADDVTLGRPVELLSRGVAPGAEQTTNAALARLASLRHPGVATVLDAEVAGGRMVVAWPAWLGRPLGAADARVGAVLDGLAQAADALDHAHRLRLAHGSLGATAIEVRPGTSATVVRLRRLGAATLAATAASRPDPASVAGDRVAFAALARQVLAPDAGDAAARIARLGHPVEIAPSTARSPEATALLDSVAVRQAATQSCTALVATIRQLLRA